MKKFKLFKLSWVYSACSGGEGGRQRGDLEQLAIIVCRLTPPVWVCDWQGVMMDTLAVQYMDGRTVRGWPYITWRSSYMPHAPC